MAHTFPLDRLIAAYNLMRNTRLDRRVTTNRRLSDLTAEEWLKLYDAYAACGWDLTPCQWQSWQIQEAICRGIIPAWDDDEDPIDGYLPDAESSSKNRGMKACSA